jgi:hypothetical protein
MKLIIICDSLKVIDEVDEIILTQEDVDYPLGLPTSSIHQIQPLAVLPNTDRCILKVYFWAPESYTIPTGLQHCYRQR